MRCRSLDTPEVGAVIRLLEARNVPVRTLRNFPRRGMAQQRAFLLSTAAAPYCLFLDDDVIMESDLLERMLGTLREQLLHGTA